MTIPGVQKPHLDVLSQINTFERFCHVSLLRAMKLCHTFLKWMRVIDISKTLDGDNMFPSD